MTIRTHRRAAATLAIAALTAATTTLATVGTSTAALAATDTTPATQGTGVVLINTTTPLGRAAGTGMVLSSDGWVLTNSHVVAGSSSVTVTLPSTGQSWDATVVGRNATQDVAVLHLDDASNLPTITLDDDPVTQGESVTALGNAQGVQHLVAASGTLTDLSTTVTVGEEGSTSTETLQDVYQTDAQAQPGDSGGPLYDDEGEVMGMVSAGSQTSSRTGAASTVASFAIPIRSALFTAEQLIALGLIAPGSQATPYLGVQVTPDLAVREVVADSAAARAGLQPGSTITALAGHPVATQSTLAGVLQSLRAGQKTTVAWQDNQGVDHTANLTLGALN